MKKSVEDVSRTGLEEAVRYFERATRTCLTAHCHRNDYLSRMLGEFGVHRFEACASAKMKHAARCLGLDFARMRDMAWQYPDGCLKLCHAGFLEWVYPVFVRETLHCVLFSGLRNGVGVEIPAPYFCLTAEEPTPTASARVLPSPENGEIEWVFEGLRQLGARIELRLREIEARPLESMTRGEYIRYLISGDRSRMVRLEEIAEKLHLSESRTAHVIRAETGFSYKALLEQYHLRAAAKMLLSSSRSGAEVGLACGYPNEVTFFRAFKRAFGRPPEKFRQEHRARGPHALSESFFSFS